MVMRLQIALTSLEADGLLKLANADLRDPREQMRFILRKELERAGLLVLDSQSREEQPAEEVER
mgnify:FL=1